jgi:hypothetical protein
MRRAAALSIAVVTLAACGGNGGGNGPGGGGGGGRLAAEVASFDLAAGVPSRFMVGLFTQDPAQGNLFVSGGSVDLRFFFLGEGQAEGREAAGEAEASFLPVEGSAGPFPAQPTAVAASTGRGVYRVPEWEFDRPGFWEVEVHADLASGAARTTAAFEVLRAPLVAAVGDRAPETENLTLDTYEDDDAPAEAVDSRAASGDIPDPELHDATIADAIRDGRPVLAVFATPVYCVSKFCGPITDLISDLERGYGDRAEFVHIEIWRDFEGQVVNRAAADWILTEETLEEPWVFLVDADGVITQRWDNVATRQEIEPFLQDLPAA